MSDSEGLWQPPPCPNEEHNHCSYRHSLKSPCLKTGMRSNTVCDKKTKYHIKWSMLLPIQDGSSAFAVFPRPPKDREVDEMGREAGCRWGGWEKEGEGEGERKEVVLRGKRRMEDPKNKKKLEPELLDELKERYDMKLIYCFHLVVSMKPSYRCGVLPRTSGVRLPAWWNKVRTVKREME